MALLPPSEGEFSRLVENLSVAAAPTPSALIGIFDPRGDLGHSDLPALGRDVLASGRAIADGAMFAGRYAAAAGPPVSRAGRVWCLLQGTVYNIAEARG